MPKLGYKPTQAHRDKLSAAKRGRFGSLNNGWKGGRFYSEGYVHLIANGHPRADKRGYVQEHKLVMEKYLGRYLNDNEVVHHKNGILDDNRIENLLLFTNHSTHLKYEWSEGAFKFARGKEWREKLSKSHLGKIPWNKGMRFEVLEGGGSHL